MLVLTRSVNERINLNLEDGRVIKLFIVRVRQGRVRIGIEAPKTIEICRDNAKKVTKK